MKTLEIISRRGLAKLIKWLLPSQTPFKTLPHPEKPYTLLLLRPARIGDLLVSTPVIRAIWSHYPHFTLDMLLGEKNAQLLSADTHLRQIFVYRKNPFRIWQLIVTLRRQRYDVIIDLGHDRSTTVAILMQLLRAPYRISLAKKTDYAANIVVPQQITPQEGHMIQVLGQLMLALDDSFDMTTLRPYYPLSEQRQQWATRQRQQFGQAVERLIAVNISASSPTRFWGVENFIQLSRLLLDNDPQCGVWLLHAPSDQAQANQILIGVGSERCQLSPPTPHIDDFAALIHCSDVLLSPDTSAIHFASALGIPTVGLFQTKNTQWHPFGVPYRVVETAADTLAAIPVEEVFGATRQLMQQCGMT
ncbi:MAG: lipopolysaccharide heptosyltransferase family protein [Gemmatimonadetes bacterium]|nr:MAG: lipopolysaccharide heptosyltransferase family protein [Gemmatimonadota bacterium]